MYGGGGNTFIPECLDHALRRMGRNFRDFSEASGNYLWMLDGMYGIFGANDSSIVILSRRRGRG